MKLSSFSQRSLHLFHLLPFLCHEVAANTEIINFSSSRERAVDLPFDVVGNWSKLYPSDNERRWTLEPAALHTPLHRVCEQDDKAALSCPHELWLLLDLDDEKWASYSTFTLRLSWPASIPAEFMIVMYTPEDLLDLLSDRDLISTSSEFPHTSSTRHTPTTRSRYARIRVVHAGVPTPTPTPTPGSRSHLHLPPPPLAPQSRFPIPIRHPGSTDETPANVVAVDDKQQQGKGNVPLIVIVEPLYFNVLPATLLPTVGFLIPIMIAAALSVPYITAYFEPFVWQARVDLNTRMTRTSKER